MRHEIDLIEASTRPAKLETTPLPYGPKDLDPVMSPETIDYHYGKLYKGYVDRYNNGEGDPDFNYGGAMLHNIFKEMAKQLA